MVRRVPGARAPRGHQGQCAVIYLPKPQGVRGGLQEETPPQALCQSGLPGSPRELAAR